MTVLIFEGPDNLGKSTIINSLVNEYKDVKDICMMHSTGPHCKKGEDPFKCQKKSFLAKVSKIYSLAINEISVLQEHNTDNLVIFDRSWIGEYVYGQIYRNGDKAAILDMIDTCNDLIGDIKCVFVQLTASPEFIIGHDDNKSFTSNYDKEKRLASVKREIELFDEAFDKMEINTKNMVKIKVNVQDSSNPMNYRLIQDIVNEIKNSFKQVRIKL